MFNADLIGFWMFSQCFAKRHCGRGACGGSHLVYVGFATFCGPVEAPTFAIRRCSLCCSSEDIHA